ncbi:MAG: hypothetical protein ACD_9C00068G0002 [uncultured bacterium]|nr:MAG: hypothetical protein ACD_9C00068G0002 [uncultured bacterium]
MNNITKNQNRKELIKMLEAQRYLYSKAKRIFNTRISVSLTIAIIGPMLISNFDQTKVFVAAISIAYILLDIILLEKMESRSREYAAKIQELFDVTLFELGWNNVVIGKKPEMELIYENSSKFIANKKNNSSELKNWYPEKINELDPLSATLICQRSNVWWDVNLRKNFIRLLYLLLIVFLVFGICISIIKNQDAKTMVILLFSFFNLFKILLKQINSQEATIKNTEHIKDHLEKLIEDTMDGNKSKSDLKNNIRIIQDEIYRHRKFCFSLPDWLHKFFRETNEKQMVYNADIHVAKLSKVQILE